MRSSRASWVVLIVARAIELNPPKFRGTFDPDCSGAQAVFSSVPFRRAIPWAAFPYPRPARLLGSGPSVGGLSLFDGLGRDTTLDHRQIYLQSGTSLSRFTLIPWKDPRNSRQENSRSEFLTGERARMPAVTFCCASAIFTLPRRSGAVGEAERAASSILAPLLKRKRAGVHHAPARLVSRSSHFIQSDYSAGPSPCQHGAAVVRRRSHRPASS